MSETESSRAIGFILAIAAIVVLAVVGAIWVSKNSSKKEEGRHEIAIDGSYFKGPENADVTIIEFADFQCPACGTTHAVVEHVLANHPEVKYVYKHFPLKQHKNANDAALAAEAAGNQGKFFEMYNILFEKQKEWSDLDSASFKNKLEEYAKEIGVEKIELFRQQFNDQEYQDKIDKDVEDGQKANVDSTPTIFINGNELQSRSLEAFEAAIESAKSQRANSHESTE